MATKPNSSPLTVRHKSYCSIENITNENYIQKLKFEGKLEGEWIVTEKIHGANFCMIVTATSIQCSRRKALLTEEEFFYNWKELRKKYSDSARFIFNTLTKDMEDEEKCTTEVRIYGELYGGYYPGLGTEEPAIRVQKGLYYAPYNDFIVFDIKSGKGYIDFYHMREICSKTTLRTTDPLTQGTFTEVINFNPLFETKLPGLLGFDPTEDNICEGVIIRPNQTQFLHNGTRVIIKKKNERFAEITGSVAKPKKVKTNYEIPKASEEFNLALEEFQGRYFNGNRLAAVISKIGPVTHLQFDKLRGMLAQDALKDFTKIYKDFDKLKPKEVALLKKFAPSFAIAVCTEYFNDLER